jgi:hypothetical protein
VVALVPGLATGLGMVGSTRFFLLFFGKAITAGS